MTYVKGKKSSIEQQNYDILVFCLENDRCISIPSFIKVLADGLFLYNKGIRRVNFQHDSNIEEISIPSSLKIIGLNCFINCKKT